MLNGEIFYINIFNKINYSWYDKKKKKKHLIIVHESLAPL